MNVDDRTILLSRLTVLHLRRHWHGAFSMIIFALNLDVKASREDVSTGGKKCSGGKIIIKL